MSHSGPEVRIATRPGAHGHVVARALALTLSLALGLASPASAAPYVFVDPGHGGPYSNANRYGLKEKHVNLWLSLELKRQLELEGFQVGMTRSRDRAVSLADIPTWQWSDALGWRYAPDGRVRYSDGVPRDDLQARCDLANAAGADIFISIHNNGARSSRANGTEVWASPRDPLGISLSRYVQKAVVEQTRLRNRGAFKIDFYVVRWANMPAILVEGAFLTNRADARRMSSPLFRRKLARGIVIGLERWLATDPFKQHLPRYAGETPADVAVAASTAGWPEGARAVVLASSADPSYALAAGPYARSLGAPVLYADASGLPAATSAELARLRPDSIVALGTTATLPAAVVDAAAVAAGSPKEVRRIAGTDAYDQTALLAAEPGMIAAGTAVVVSDATPGDITAAASFAAASGGPLLLVPAGGALPASIAAFLDGNRAAITRTIVLGGPGAIPESTLASIPGGVRLAEPDPFRNNASLNFVARPSGPLRTFVVSPSDAALGIVATAAAAHVEGGTVLLNEGRVMSPYTRLWITRVRGRDVLWTIVGGPASQPYLVDWMVDKAAG